VTALLVGSSALFAILAGEPEAERMSVALARADHRVISAFSLVGTSVALVRRKGEEARGRAGAFVASGSIRSMMRKPLRDSRDWALRKGAARGGFEPRRLLHVCCGPRARPADAVEGRGLRQDGPAAAELVAMRGGADEHERASHRASQLSFHRSR
jgi:hypothetical protein